MLIKAPGELIEAPDENLLNLIIRDVEPCRCCTSQNAQAAGNSSCFSDECHKMVVKKKRFRGTSLVGNNLQPEQGFFFCLRECEKRASLCIRFFKILYSSTLYLKRD